MPHDSTSTPRRIAWYRTPVDKDALRKLTERSDLLGGLQTAAYLATFALTAALCLYSWRHWPWYALAILLLLHGTVAAFAENGMHELGHGTVFRSDALNEVFIRAISFLGFLNFVTFHASHTRHHAYTLHPPDDLEVVLPMGLTWREFLRQGFVDPVRFHTVLGDTIRIALGRFRGEWELRYLPASDARRRAAATHWARVLLGGHGLLIAVSVSTGWWLLPVLSTLTPLYGGWLCWLCNNTQHIAMQTNVSDFRLCCRSFTANPIIRLLDWHMNYHVEHHMYPAVPGYRLAQLHRTIAHDQLRSPAGVLATWREIAASSRAAAFDAGGQST